MILRTLIAAFALVSCCTFAIAWDGMNTSTGSSVEIDRGQLVRSGKTIEVYDSGAGSKSYNVESINRSGGTVEIEVTDTSTGETTTLKWTAIRNFSALAIATAVASQRNVQKIIIHSKAV